MVFSSINISQTYTSRYDEEGRYLGEEQDGYDLTQGMTVTSHDIDKVEEISRDITTLIEAGVELESQQPEYYYTKLDEMKLERAIERAMIEGTDEAVEEAERIKRQNDSPDIQMTDMVDLADSADLKKSVDQNLGDIKSSMKVLKADLKGIKVDEKA